jgi:tetratricopeptide (TPR) repeat protein
VRPRTAVAPPEPRPSPTPASRMAPPAPLEQPEPAPARAAQPLPAPRPTYDALLAEGHTALDGGKHEEALRKYDDAMRLCPERPEAYFEQAVLLTEREMHPAARELLDRALALDACFLPAMVLLARVHLRTGKAEKAHALLLQVVTALSELDQDAPLQGWPSMNAGALRKSCERLLERGAMGEAR